MEKTLFKGFSAMAAVCVLCYTSSCNSGSKNQNETDSSFNQEAYTEQVEGVYEYLPPYQGYAIMINGRYVFMFGQSDSTMYCHAGTYEISGDTITNKVLHAFNPEQRGNTFSWMSKLLPGDTIVVNGIDSDGNITQTVKSIKKINANKTNLSAMKDYEGIFQYFDLLQGQAILFGGYYAFLYGNSDTTMYAHAGTYKSLNDTITNKILFAKNPETMGSEFRWTSESIIGDTATYVIVDNQGKEVDRGRSLKIK